MALTQMEKIILTNINEAINKAVVERLSSYNSPIGTLVDEAIKTREQELRVLIQSSLDDTIKKEDFKIAVKNAFDHKLARVMVDSIAGSIDKAINAFKSDPTIKAKMVLAVEKIITESSKT